MTGVAFRALASAKALAGLVLGMVVLTGPGTVAHAQEPAPEQLLEHMRTAYGALRAYADTGTVLTEDRLPGGPMVTEQHRFITRFAAPRQFYFDFTKHSSGERYVIWCPGETFSTWWSATQTVEAYARGEGLNAFALGEFPTIGAALLVPPLLFPGSGLHGPLADFSAARYAGTVGIAERPHHVLEADLRVNHWGETTRLTRIWIDAETHLVRKIVQDTPSGMGSGAVQRTTVLVDLVADPQLDAASFSFAPPAP